MWQIELRHEGLNKYRLIRGNDKYVVEQKAAAQKAAWDEMWQKKLEKQRKGDEKQSKIQEAIERSKQALEAINVIEKTLKHSLQRNDMINWDNLKDHSDFTDPKPEPSKLLEVPQLKLNFFDRILASRRRRKNDKWLKQKQETNKINYELMTSYHKNLKQWEANEQIFLNKQKETNAAINRRKEQYLAKQPDALFDYFELVLSNSEYPDYFPQDCELDYNPQTKVLVLDYSLPSVDEIPRVKDVKYVQLRDEIVESFLTEPAVNKLYDDLVYQITLRTLHELYESDAVGGIDSIVFNGWVKSIDKATGQQVNACIISVQANRQEFSFMNLENVDPKSCFKKLKGVGSSKLHSLIPIAPILNISREDKRFISSYEVVDKLNESDNLAAMDWEDFEHLIRELFEKEFSQSGGEVRVTQASRDGGVDAIAFDPDPIRGGKIVIQAKRYTNTVGVSAVRDLFGAVMNEGATKGILVTTADYGPDAYEFAKGKPLTLLNGSNLLHLLEKHSHKAIIDLKAARKILSEKERKKELKA